MSEFIVELQRLGADLDESLSELNTEEQRRLSIAKYLVGLTSSEKLPESFLPAFSADLTWFNVAEPLALEHFYGRVVVLDFFTYCCINCMHILPDLEALEERHPPHENRVLVVGIHSAKFENERVSANIANAVKRYGIRHPVVNDSEAVWWNDLGICCWPTLLVLDPRSRPIRIFMGEGHRRELLEFVDVALDFFQKDIKNARPLPDKTELGQQLKRKSILSFPGKVLCAGDRLFVSDTGNHRIVIADSSGAVKHVIGSGSRGFRDGSFKGAQFSSPQGLCLTAGNDLVVSDTENHALRLIDLEKETVTTLAGVGEQGHDLEGGQAGAKQPLSSPWDVCLGSSPLSEELDTVFIAMAGSHQIWGFALEDSVWWKGVRREKGSCFAVAGNGNEENRNNSYPTKAGFAQPSGISFSVQHRSLFIADSESSSVRVLNVKDGSVKNVCGGSRDPSDLFAFGDADGAGVEVRLQHPLAVTYCIADDTLMVADSYNHKIKRVSGLGGKKQVSEGLIGAKESGDEVGGFAEARFDEPGGLCMSDDGGKMYIADTNNNAIKVVDLKERSCQAINLGHRTVDVVDKSPNKKKYDLKMNKTARISKNANSFTITFLPKFVSPCKLNPDAPSNWQLHLPNGISCMEGLRGKLEKSGAVNWTISVDSSLTKFTWQAEVRAFLCDSDSGVCYVKNILLEIDCLKTSDGFESNFDFCPDVACCK